MDAMQNKSFCTISTLDYMPYVYTLYDSLKRYDADIVIDVFVSDAGRDSLRSMGRLPNVRFYCVEDVCKSGLGRNTYEKYHAVSMDKLRWSMKSVFLRYLIEHAGRQKVIYVDNDICFFNDYAFLFDELDSSDVILTPHWRSSDPHVDSKNFFTLNVDGLYNGGFVGVNKNAVRALEWWAMACLYVCEKNVATGQWDDQAHLNLLPIYFDNVKIIKHRGCNVANWNLVECTRVQTGDRVLINGKDPIVFMHFTKSTIRGILKGKDALLAPFLERYHENLKRYGVQLLTATGDEKKNAAKASKSCAIGGIFQRIRTFFDR